MTLTSVMARQAINRPEGGGNNFAWQLLPQVTYKCSANRGECPVGDHALALWGATKRIERKSGMSHPELNSLSERSGFLYSGQLSQTEPLS
ncbi:hypothetical protein D3C80_1830750 [compost metagenome]